MTLPQLLKQIDKQGHINYKQFMIDAVKGGYYNLLVDNQEVLCAVIDEHNALLDKENTANP